MALAPRVRWGGEGRNGGVARQHDELEQTGDVFIDEGGERIGPWLGVETEHAEWRFGDVEQPCTALKACWTVLVCCEAGSTVSAESRKGRRQSSAPEVI